jgi:hypothetical protein
VVDILTAKNKIKIIAHIGKRSRRNNMSEKNVFHQAKLDREAVEKLPRRGQNDFDENGMLDFDDALAALDEAAKGE